MQHLNQYIEITDCFYYVFSNIYKRIQELGLQQRYNEDQDFTLSLRMVSAIAYLPPNDVTQGFEQFWTVIFATSIMDMQMIYSINWNTSTLEGTDEILHVGSHINNSAEWWHSSFKGHISHIIVSSEFLETH